MCQAQPPLPEPETAALRQDLADLEARVAAQDAVIARMGEAYDAQGARLDELERLLRELRNPKGEAHRE